MATNKEYKGKRITLLDGTRDTIVTVGNRSYKTKKGLTLKTNQVEHDGRKLVEAALVSVKKKDKPVKKADKKPAKKVAKSKNIDWDAMTRREVISKLVEMGILANRKAATGTGVDEMRIMGAKGKKAKATAEEKPAKKKPSKKTTAKEEKVGRRRVRTSDEEKPAKKKPSKKKLAAAVETELKTVKRISEKMARRTESKVEEHIEEWLRKITGYNLTVACVGGVFNESRLTIQVGILPTDASDDDIAAYSADMTGVEETEAEEDEIEAEDTDELEEEDGDELSIEEIVADLVERTGVDEAKATKFVNNWYDCHADDIDDTLGDEVKPGMLMTNKEGDEFIIIGWLPKKGKVAAYSVEEEKMVPLTLKAVAHFEFVEEESDDDDLDMDLDDDLEDEEFDEELDADEDDLEEDEDEDEDDLEEDEDEDDLEEDEDEDDLEEDEDEDEDEFDEDDL